MWCYEQGITHLTGAPYHPATNGAAERLVQTFKQALKKSESSPRAALQEFLLQYRRTPLPSGYSPSELLNGRQIRTKIDTLLPSPAHKAQGQQARAATKSQTVTKVETTYTVGSPCYALYCGPHRDKEPRWVPATVVRLYGSRSLTVRVHPRGPIWRRHVEQLRPRYGIENDTELAPEMEEETTVHNGPLIQQTRSKYRNPRMPDGNEYGRHNLRRSRRDKNIKKN